MNDLIAVLTRIADTLDAMASGQKPTSNNSQPLTGVNVRSRLMEMYDGQWVTTAQIADALGMENESARRIGAIASEAGFVKKRSANGVMFAIGDAWSKPATPGPVPKLPADIEEKLALIARAGLKRTPLQILGMCYGTHGNYSRGMVELLRERIKDEPYYAEVNPYGG